MRDAPSIPIVGRLAEDGALIRTFDPAGMEQARPMLPASVAYCESALDAAQGADLLVVATEWNEFRAIDPERLRAAMRGDLVVDLRNMYERASMVAAGFRYHSIGRP